MPFGGFFRLRESPVLGDEENAGENEGHSNGFHHGKGIHAPDDGHDAGGQRLDVIVDADDGRTQAFLADRRPVPPERAG